MVNRIFPSWEGQGWVPIDAMRVTHPNPSQEGKDLRDA